MTLCKCGCKQEVNPGNKWIKGHNARCFSEETKKKIGKASKKRVCSEETKRKLSKIHKGKILSEETKKKIGEGNRGHKHSKETIKKIGNASRGRIKSSKERKKLSEVNKGKILSEEHKRKFCGKNKGKAHPNFKHGKGLILTLHKQHKKEECIFGCENDNYNLHHEPELDYENILEWEGELINLCHSCHRKVHTKTLKLPDKVGIKWIKKDTEEGLNES